jgi:hypothetical protein
MILVEAVFDGCTLRSAGDLCGSRLGLLVRGELAISQAGVE